MSLNCFFISLYIQNLWIACTCVINCSYVRTTSIALIIFGTDSSRNKSDLSRLSLFDLPDMLCINKTGKNGLNCYYLLDQCPKINIESTIEQDLNPNFNAAPHHDHDTFVFGSLIYPLIFSLFYWICTSISSFFHKGVVWCFSNIMLHALKGCRL